MKKQRRTIGAFVAIPLSTGQFAYARILDDAEYAVYDLVTSHVETDVELIRSKPVLFLVAVYNDAVTSGRWEKIGKMPLEDNLRVLPLKFIQDAIHPEQFSIYNPNTGEIRETTKVECVGLERVAVWEPEHVESRIIDYYAGRPNVWVEQMKLT